MTSGVFTIPWVSAESLLPAGNPDAVPGSAHRHFVAGPENYLLRALADAVLIHPPRWNPITLCGPTGVGKSHLLHGLVEHQRTWSPGHRMVLVTGADFARGYARAVEVDSISDWRNKHTQVDLFVLDDLQELQGKEGSQQELIHALDALHQQDRQILVACRQPVLDWNWMLPGLQSRLVGGLVIPVAPPSEPTQRYMVQEILRQLGCDPAAEVALPKAASPRTYVQIRQAILQQLHLPAASERDEESEETPDDFPSPRAALKRIAKQVARQNQVKLADLLGPSRRQTVVRARGIAFYAAKILLGLSFEEIGEYFGRRDHTTVLHSWRKTSERLQTDVRFKHEVDKLIALCADNFEVQQR